MLFSVYSSRLNGIRRVLLAIGCVVFTNFSRGGQISEKNADFLIESWQDRNGVPESSALAVAQTPDGYIWVGSNEGLLRFNGVNFLRAEKFSDITRLSSTMPFLETDRSGRLWAGGEGRMALYDFEYGTWQKLGGTNIDPRSVAEDVNGLVLIGGGQGELYTVTNGAVENAPAPEGLRPSGVFCITDAKDGQIWLANKGFIGRHTAQGWIRLDRPGATPRTLVAARARTGGIWVFTPGELRCFTEDGGIKSFPAPNLDQPRDMIEDRNGNIWIATISRGLVRFRPGGGVSVINNTNGLSHITVRSVMEDREGNIWAGGSLNGLNRLKPRQFVTISEEQGLSDNIVRTISETSLGQIIVGTHGGGIAYIRDGKVEKTSSIPNDADAQFVWSLIQDRTGRLWIGTYNNGLFVQDQGFRHPFPLPAAFGDTVTVLKEDANGRIWAGGPVGLGLIEGNAMTRCFTNTLIDGFAVIGLAEDTNAGVLWIGTYSHGLFRMDSKTLAISPLPGLPGNRISSLTLDDKGYLWIGVFEHGLACFHDGKTTLVGPDQGLSADTIGSILDDGQGWFWLGSTHGILRVSKDDLRRVAGGQPPPARFNLFNASDGLGSDYCVEGYQPNALRDHTGRLWFSTDGGVVTVDPARLSLNTNPPPMVIREVQFTDRFGHRETMDPGSGQIVVPPGGSDFQVDYDCLSYTAPEKVNFRYQLEGVNGSWVNLGNSRMLHFRQLSPGHYVLHLGAANNDGVWNNAGAALSFVIRPYVWQTAWFRVLGVLVFVGVGGFAVWRITRQRYQLRLEQFQQQRRIEQQAEAEIQRREKYFRQLTENSSDSITVINAKGMVTYQSASGLRLFGRPSDTVLGRNLFDLVHGEDQPKAQSALKQILETPGVPVTLIARLQHQDGTWRTIETVGTSHESGPGEKQIVLNSRDITENLKLEAQLRQAQKMEAVGQLAGGVAHDFNNILTSLRLQAELLEMTQQLPDGVKEGLQQICADTHRAADLTRQLLLFSRRQVMQLRVLDVNQVVTNVAKMLKRIIREDIRLQLNLHPNPLLTRADAGMLDQVLINLAVNARDAMSKAGSIHIETTPMDVNAQHARANPDAVPGRYVSFSVRDTGGGIPPEVLPRIFEPFFTTKEAGKGTGLGLATVFGIVKQHQGWIKLDNRPGDGMTFHVYLPASNAPASAPDDAVVKPKPRGGKETILLVEDEWGVRMSTRLILERHGYKVLEAVDAAEALKIWAEQGDSVALLLSDLVMPGEMGGRDLGRKLEAERPSLKVIYASGYSAEIAGRDFELKPGEAFIQKPFETDRLLEMIRRSLDS